jgi:hypothetical protein
MSALGEESGALCEELRLREKLPLSCGFPFERSSAARPRGRDVDGWLSRDDSSERANEGKSKTAFRSRRKGAG